MRRALKIYNSWHATRRSCFIVGTAQLILTYFFAIHAIDTARWWAYILTLILLAGSIRSFVEALHPAFKNHDRH